MAMDLPDAALEQLHQALDTASSVAVSCMPSGEAVDWLCELQTIRSRLDSVVCCGLADVGPDGVTEGGETGHRSVGDLVAARCKTRSRGQRSPQGEAQLGTWLAGYPIIAAAFEQGAISADHVRAIRARENRRTRPHLEPAQEYLVEAAERCNWTEFQAALRYWELCADPDGEEPEEQLDNRRCNYKKHADGTVTGNFSLDPLAGCAFITALETHVQRLFRQDAEAGNKRTASQRRVDALVELIASGDPNVKIPTPLIHLILGEDVLADALSRLDDRASNNSKPAPPSQPQSAGPTPTGATQAEPSPADPPTTEPMPAERRPATSEPQKSAPAESSPHAAGSPPHAKEPQADGSLPDQPWPRQPDPWRLPVDHDNPTRRCELIDGTPIHPRLALAAAATAHVRRLVLGAESEVLDLGRTVRTFPRHLKQLLLILARGRCQSPGCDAPLAWLQADHYIPWSRDGPTSLANGHILCDPHNKKKRDRQAPDTEGQG